MKALIEDARSYNALVKMTGGKEALSRHIGYVYSISFNEAMVLTNDSWKEKVSGIPHNSFLIASSFDPNDYENSHVNDKEVVLLRVTGTAQLPSDFDTLKAKIEHNQRKTQDEVFSTDTADGMDVLTQSELQFGGLTCRILGTFYFEDENKLRLGSDIESYMSASRLRVFKPDANALEAIVNHINPEIKKKSLEEARKSGFTELPTEIEIGTVRYTSSSRLHRGPDEKLVPVRIQPSDFLARRTAMLGMTRTGKSNTVKTTISAVELSARKSGIKVGQIIFDLNGEYANANHQDDGSSIADVFENDCMRYRSMKTDGFKDLRTNFFLDPSAGLNLISKLAKEQSKNYSQDLQVLFDVDLTEADPTDRGETNRFKVKKAAFQCLLNQAGYKAPKSFKVSFPVNAKVKGLVEGSDISTEVHSLPMDISSATKWLLDAREVHYELKAENNLGLPSSTKGKAWIDGDVEAILNVMARKNSHGSPIFGYRELSYYKEYHSPSTP